MKRTIAEWIWRVAVVAALLWIGLELHRFHEDMMPPAADEQDASTGSDSTVQDGIDDLRDDVARLEEKVNAVLTVMARTK